MIRAAEQLLTTFHSTVRTLTGVGERQFSSFKQELLTTDLQLSDLKLKLNDLMGPSCDHGAWTLVLQFPNSRRACSREECVKSGTGLASRNPRSSGGGWRKPKAAIRLAKTDIWVLDVEAFRPL